MIADPAKFVVQSRCYEQCYGYPLWCAHVLNKLLSNPPSNAKDLIEKAAEYMGDKADPEYKRIYIRACRFYKRRYHGNHDVIFGPAAAEDFGKLGGHTLLVTPIGQYRTEEQKSLFTRPGYYRGYYEIVEKNQPEWMSSEPTEAIEFTYPIPDTQDNLQLMSIGRPTELFNEEQFKYRYRRSKEEYLERARYRDLAFRHPLAKDDFYNNLILCLEPLYQTIFNQNSTQEQKAEASTEFYWLVAQSTPVTRGGSAHSKIILEYLSLSLGVELPYLKAGCDMWAEAATTSLEKFKENFKQENFFDRSITSKDVLEFHPLKSSRQITR